MREWRRRQPIFHSVHTLLQNNGRTNVYLLCITNVLLMRQIDAGKKMFPSKQHPTEKHKALWGYIMSMMCFCWLIFPKMLFSRVHYLGSENVENINHPLRRGESASTEHKWHETEKLTNYNLYEARQVWFFPSTRKIMGIEFVWAKCVDGMKFKAFAYTHRCVHRTVTMVEKMW